MHIYFTIEIFQLWVGIRNDLKILENQNFSLCFVLMSVISHNWKLQKLINSDLSGFFIFLEGLVSMELAPSSCFNNVCLTTHIFKTSCLLSFSGKCWVSNNLRQWKYLLCQNLRIIKHFNWYCHGLLVDLIFCFRSAKNDMPKKREGRLVKVWDKKNEVLSIYHLILMGFNQEFRPIL